jgi:hypothetical protein
VLPNQASFLAFALVVPIFLFVLYRSVAPYELVLKDLKLAGAILWPLLLGSFVGGAHLTLDSGLVAIDAAPLAFIVLYPVIETFIVFAVFNRRFFLKQASSPMYFAIGGAALALPLGYMEGVRTLSFPSTQWNDAGALGTVLALDVAFVFFHASKGLFLGSFVALNQRVKGAAFATALEAPFGLLYLAGLLGIARYEALGLMVAYAIVVYVIVWHRFFRRAMPPKMRDAMARSRKRVPGQSLVRRKDPEVVAEAPPAEQQM